MTNQAGPDPRPLARPPIANLHLWQIQAVRDVLFILAIVALVWAGYAMRTVTVPLLVALTLAYLFEPLVSYLTRRYNASRPIVVGTLVLTFGLTIVLVLAIAIPLIVGQSIRLVRDVRAGRFENSLMKLQEYVPTDFQDDYATMIGFIHPGTRPGESAFIADEPVDMPTTKPETGVDTIGDELRVREIVREELLRVSAGEEDIAAGSSSAGSFVKWARSSANAVFGLLGSVVTLGLLVFLIPFYFFFFSVSYPAIARFGRTLVPLSNRARTLELVGKMDRAVAGFVRGRIVICLIMGVMLAIGWWFCGVPYSIVLGFVIGAFSLVPYLGGIGVPLAVGLLAIEQFNLPDDQQMAWWAVILWPSVVFGIVQVVETYLLTPMIAGKATNLDPVTILVAVLAGGSVGGIYGMILAIPVAACLKILITDVVLPKIHAWTKGEAEDPLPISRQ
jgi:predicted PurR-regulated permease PerM